MAKQKPKTPYQHLIEKCKTWAFSVVYPRRTIMFVIPKARLSEAWTLADVYERTKAADQLGYDVVLVAADRGLEMFYRKRPKTTPWEIAP